MTPRLPEGTASSGPTPGPEDRGASKGCPTPGDGASQERRGPGGRTARAATMGRRRNARNRGDSGRAGRANLEVQRRTHGERGGRVCVALLCQSHKLQSIVSHTSDHDLFTSSPAELILGTDRWLPSRSRRPLLSSRAPGRRRRGKKVRSARGGRWQNAGGLAARTRRLVRTPLPWPDADDDAAAAKQRRRGRVWPARARAPRLGLGPEASDRARL